MSNTICSDTRFKCGPLTPSACVPFTGALPTYVPEETFPCNVNIDDIFATINTTIQSILTGLDLTSLTPQCLSFNPATVTQTQLNQVQINQICGILASLTALQTQVNELNISTETINIDLQCLTPDSNPCSQTPNTYTLSFILTTLLTRVCLLSTQVATLQTQVAALS